MTNKVHNLCLQPIDDNLLLRYAYNMANRYENRRVATEVTKRFINFLDTSFKFPQQDKIAELAGSLALDVLESCERQTGVRDQKLYKVAKVVCEQYISGFETDSSVLMKQFELFELEATGDRKDLIREALETAESYRLEFEEIANNSQATQAAEVNPSIAHDDTDEMVAEVQIGSKNDSNSSSEISKSISERWAEAEEKAKDNAQQGVAQVVERAAKSAKERWDEAEEAARKRNAQSRSLER